ncbi:MAG TPA: hypothetical protein VG165_03365 [Solirubrobacteraceae bacterium]|jgi:hypothetical protein|nr:hypothetical protein [Solirubrobacteraceae bacterium]
MLDKPTVVEGSRFEAREIRCTDRDAAVAEAQRQEVIDADGAEWIYLRHDGAWVARRVAATKPRSRKRALFDALAESFQDSLFR